MARAVGIWGVILFLILHVPPVRRAAWEGAKLVWKGLRAVLIEAPAAFFRLPAVEDFLDSRAMLFLRRRLMVAANPAERPVPGSARSPTTSVWW